MPYTQEQLNASIADRLKTLSQYIPMIGSDFIGSEGERLTCFQLLRDGKSIAIVDFEGEKVWRLLSIDGIDKAELLALARDFRSRSIPVQFSTEPAQAVALAQKVAP